MPLSAESKLIRPAESTVILPFGVSIVPFVPSLLSLKSDPAPATKKHCQELLHHG